jgi:hypothetical protein
MAQLPKPHTIEWPPSPKSFEDIDFNFDLLFRQVQQNATVGVLPVTQGGTGLGVFTRGDLLYADTITSIAGLHDVTTGNVVVSGGVNEPPQYGKVALSGVVTHITGTLPATNGGTGFASYAVGDLLYASTTTALAKLADIATGNALITGGVATAPAWGKIGLTTHVSGVLPVPNGGTNIASYAVGDLLYASASTTLSKLADVATGNALLSGGVTTAPLWGKIGLTTHVTGILPVANGGTGLSSYTTGDLVYASASGTLAGLADIATGNALLSGGVGVAPAYGKIGLTTHVSGVLPIANGGTNLSSYAQGDLIYASATNVLSALAKNTTATRYLANTGTSNAPAWDTVSLTNGVTGLLAKTQGGTGLTATSRGDLLVGSTSTTQYGVIAAVAGGNTLISQGGTTEPIWGKINLNTTGVSHVTGTLQLSEGGTAATTASDARTSLGLGTMATQNASAVAITGGTITVATYVQVTGATAPAAGAGAEITYNGTTAIFGAFDRTGAAYLPTTIRGLNIQFNIAGTVVSTIDGSGHFLPQTDNTYNNGDATHRWKLVRGVTVTAGDLRFDNKWTITEHDKVGIEQEGLAFLDASNAVVGFLGARGVWYVGETRPLSELHWRRTTHAERVDER